MYVQYNAEKLDILFNFHLRKYKQYADRQLSLSRSFDRNPDESVALKRFLHIDRC
jgi:hypothetical protein